MVLNTDGSQLTPTLPPEEQESLVETFAFPILNFIQYSIARASAIATIQSLIRRPEGSKDNLTSTVLRASFPSAWNLTLSVGASIGAVGAILVPWCGLYFGIKFKPRSSHHKIILSNH